MLKVLFLLSFKKTILCNVRKKKHYAICGQQRPCTLCGLIKPFVASIYRISGASAFRISGYYRIYCQK